MFCVTGGAGGAGRSFPLYCAYATAQNATVLGQFGVAMKRPASGFCDFSLLWGENRPPKVTFPVLKRTVTTVGVVNQFGVDTLNSLSWKLAQHQHNAIGQCAFDCYFVHTDLKLLI